MDIEVTVNDNNSYVKKDRTSLKSTTNEKNEGIVALLRTM